MSNIHRCDECSRSFATKKGLFIHIRSSNHSKFAKRIEEEQKIWKIRKRRRWKRTTPKNQKNIQQEVKEIMKIWKEITLI